MNVSSVWHVLKWVLAALAAGFVGQFGRVLAMRLIARRRKKRDTQANNTGGGMTSHLEFLLNQERVKALVKLEKKRAKAQVKKNKEKGLLTVKVR